MSAMPRRLFHGFPAMRLPIPLRTMFRRMRIIHDRWANDEDFATEGPLGASILPKDRDIKHSYRAYFPAAESKEP